MESAGSESIKSESIASQDDEDDEAEDLEDDDVQGYEMPSQLHGERRKLNPFMAHLAAIDHESKQDEIDELELE